MLRDRPHLIGVDDHLANPGHRDRAGQVRLRKRVGACIEKCRDREDHPNARKPDGAREGCETESTVVRTVTVFWEDGRTHRVGRRYLDVLLSKTSSNEGIGLQGDDQSDVLQNARLRRRIVGSLTELRDATGLKMPVGWDQPMAT